MKKWCATGMLAVLLVQSFGSAGLTIFAQEDMSIEPVLSSASTDSSENQQEELPVEEGSEESSDKGESSQVPTIVSTHSSSSTLEQGLPEEEEESTKPTLAKKAPQKESRRAAHVRALFPVTENGTIQLTTSNQSMTRLALVSHTDQVSYGQPDAQNAYIPMNTAASSQLDQLRGDFAGVTFEQATASLQIRIRALDRITMKAELTRRWGRTPSDAEVETELRAGYLDRLDMRAAFERVKTNLDTWLLALLERSDNVNVATVRQQKERILLALTYLERQYSFSFQGIEAKYLLALHPEVFTGQTSSAIDRVAAIGNLTFADLELQNAAATYTKKMAGVTGQAQLMGFLDKSVALFVPGTNPADWFKQTSKAYIVETQSQRAGTSLYEKMRTDNRLNQHLIALLTVSDRSVYAISTMSSVTYGSIGTYVDAGQASTWSDFEAQIAKIASEQEAFFDTWYRITDKKAELLAANVLVIDTMQGYRSNQGQTASSLWSPRSGDTALLGVREFFSPLNYYRTFLQAGAEADTGSRTFAYFMFRVLSRHGQETFTHEVTHLLDKTVWFNGHGTRTAQGAEVYARGLFEIIDNSPGVSDYKPVFNLNLSYELGDNRTQNASPSRFGSEADLQTYMKGVMDVLYTLDYAEAQASLGLSDADKVLLYNQMSLVPDTRSANQVKDKFAAISTTQASGLKTINDLIDQGMVSSRLTFQGNLTTGEVKPNGYYVIPLFNPIYAALQNDAGSVGDMSFRRNAYELLAAYGYKNGMVPYLSNQHGGSDQAALAAIMDGEHGGQLTTFKKAMFQERIDKLNRLKPVADYADFAAIQKAMQQAVATDLAQMKTNQRNRVSLLHNVSAVESLKLKIYQGYLKDTQDFRGSIYQDEQGQQTEEIREDIPIDTVERTDDQLWAGEIRTAEGQVGQRLVTKVWQTVNGQRVGEPQVTTKVLVDMKPKIIYTGTKKTAGEIRTSREVEIPIEDEQLEDANLWAGETRVVEGTVGRKRLTTIQPTEKGQPVGSARTEETILVPMVKRKVYTGTKKTAGEIRTSREVEIPIEDEQLEDANLWAGETRVVEGTVGRKRITTIQPTEKGQPVGSARTEEMILVPMVKRKVYKGTKKTAGETRTSREVEIPIEDEQLEDANLWAGETRVVEGTVGRKRITTIQPTEKGQPVGSARTEEMILVPMVKRKVYTGTKPRPIQDPASALLSVYRLYHPGLKVHLYTTDTNERDVLSKRGWKYEGISWKTETSKGDPVYRLYHPTIKIHLYTRDANEYKVLGSRGWKQEGIAYRSYGSVPIYRLYHQGMKKHLYTRDSNERDVLQTRGWKYEGIAWYSQP